MSNIHIRQRIEVAVVRLLLECAQTAGFILYAIEDSDDVIRTKSTKHALKEVFNRDECYIKFRGADKQFFWTRIILGENGDDCISDYSTDDGPFDAMIAKVTKITNNGVITFGPCPGYVPAYDMGKDNRGVCIHCGTSHKGD